MEIISVCNRKGGVAKTTTALNLAAGLQREGKRVLLIDLDPQCCLTAHLGIDPDNVPTVFNVLTEKLSARDAILETTGGEILPASPELAFLEQRTPEEKTSLREALQPFKKGYDYCIIDTAPSLGNLLITALSSSKSALITAEAKKSSLDAIVQLNDSITAVRQHTNKRLKIKGILITKVNTRTILTKDMRSNIENLAAYLNIKVFRTMIRNCNAFAEAEALGKTIFEYAPRSNGAKDYSDLVHEILQEGD